MKQISSLTATQRFNVTVASPPRPELPQPVMTNGQLSLQVMGLSGPDYVIEATTNLAPPTLWTPFRWTDTMPASTPPRFHRARVGP